MMTHSSVDFIYSRCFNANRNDIAKWFKDELSQPHALFGWVFVSFSPSHTTIIYTAWRDNDKLQIYCCFCPFASGNWNNILLTSFFGWWEVGSSSYFRFFRFIFSSHNAYTIQISLWQYVIRFLFSFPVYNSCFGSPLKALSRASIVDINRKMEKNLEMVNLDNGNELWFYHFHSFKLCQVVVGIHCMELYQMIFPT